MEKIAAFEVEKEKSDDEKRNLEKKAAELEATLNNITQLLKLSK